MLYFIKNVRLPWLIVTLLIFSLLLKLGFWQLARAQQKQQRLNNIAQFAQHAALSLEQVLTIAHQKNHKSNNVNDLLVKVSGDFDANHVLLLDNQFNQGKIGYRVLQIFNAKSAALLVNLGWIPAGTNRQILPIIKAISGFHTITGHVRIPERGITLAQQQYQQVQWPFRIQQVELDKISSLIGKQLLPFMIYLDKNEQLGFIKNWHPIVMLPEKHRAYAFQWFSLAIAWLALMVWAAIKNNNKQGGMQ